MAYITSQRQNTGNYVATTDLWDVSRILQVDVTSAEFKELLVNLTQNIEAVIAVLNNKSNGIFPLESFLSGNQYFNPSDPSPLAQRPSYLKLVNFGALPNATDKSVPHGIDVTTTTTWITIRACGTDHVNRLGYPIPNDTNSSTGGGAAIDVDATNVTITVDADLTAFTTTIVLLEYLTY